MKINWESIIYLCETEKQKTTNVNGKNDILILKVTSENIKDILEFRSQSTLNIFIELLNNNHKGYYAYLNGKCCHCTWVLFEDGWQSISKYIEVKLNKKIGYISYCETADWARGKSIYPNVLRYIVNNCANVSKFFIVTNSKNIASIKGIEKAGFNILAKIKTYSLGEVPLPFYKVFYFGLGIISCRILKNYLKYFIKSIMIYFNIQIL